MTGKTDNGANLGFENQLWAAADKLRGHMEWLGFRSNESRTLASLRDTLLPKLISGELRVPDAGKFVEEAL